MCQGYNASVLPLSMVIGLDFGTVSTVWYFLYFILLLGYIIYVDQKKKEKENCPLQNQKILASL